MKSHTQSYRLAGGGLKLGPCQVFASRGNCCRRCLLCVDVLCGSGKHTEWISSEERGRNINCSPLHTAEPHKAGGGVATHINTTFWLPQRL